MLCLSKYWYLNSILCTRTFLYQIKLFEECTSKHRPKQILHKTSFKSKIMLQEFENTCITLTKHLGYLNCFSSCESNDSSNSLGNGFFRNNHHFPYMSSSFQMPVELILLYILYIQLYIGTGMYNDIWNWSLYLSKW